MTAEATRHDSPLARDAMLPADYSAGAHIVRTALIASGIAAVALWLARSAAPIDWVLLPAFFVVANFIEWAVHKNPMHRPMTPRILYKNHTLIHHRAFLHSSMPITCNKELGLIMMPWYTMLGLFIVASPVALLAAWWRGWGAAGIFFLAAALYFVTYEGLHALYHLPDATLARIGLGGRLFQRMRGHHRHHHRLDRMSYVNFNVTFPLMDLLLGTREREVVEPVVADAAPPAPQNARV
jgi:hypothetical protein